MLLNRLQACFCKKYWEEILMNIGLKFSKKNILFLILHVCVCQIMEVHSMLRFFWVTMFDRIILQIKWRIPF